MEDLGLIYLAGALLMGMGAIGAAIGIGMQADVLWKVLHVSLNLFHYYAHSSLSLWV